MSAFMAARPGLRRAAVATAVATAGIFASACGPLHPGAAATVGNVTISLAQVHTAAVGSLAQAQLAQDTPVAERDALTNLIRDQVVRVAAQAKGVTVTEGDIQNLLIEARAQSGSDAATAAANGVQVSDLHELVYEALLYQRLGALVDPGQTDATIQGVAVDAYLEKFSSSLRISVSPRFGTWSSKNYSVLADDAFASPAPGESSVPTPVAVAPAASAPASAVAGG